MKYQLKNEYLTVTVENRGAELQSVKGSDGTEYIWHGDPASWEDHAPVLFPFCGRLWDGYCTVDGVRCNPEVHGDFGWDDPPIVTDPGPLHAPYCPVVPPQDTVPWPEPYQTLDDDNTYTPLLHKK